MYGTPHANSVTLLFHTSCSANCYKVQFALASETSAKMRNWSWSQNDDEDLNLPKSNAVPTAKYSPVDTE